MAKCDAEVDLDGLALYICKKDRRDAWYECLHDNGYIQRESILWTPHVSLGLLPKNDFNEKWI